MKFKMVKGHFQHAYQFFDRYVDDLDFTDGEDAKYKTAAERNNRIYNTHRVGVGRWADRRTNLDELTNNALEKYGYDDYFTGLVAMRATFYLWAVDVGEPHLCRHIDTVVNNRVRNFQEQALKAGHSYEIITPLKQRHYIKPCALVIGFQRFQVYPDGKPRPDPFADIREKVRNGNSASE